MSKRPLLPDLCVRGSGFNCSGLRTKQGIEETKSSLQFLVSPCNCQFGSKFRISSAKDNHLPVNTHCKCSPGTRTEPLNSYLFFSTYLINIFFLFQQVNLKGLPHCLSGAQYKKARVSFASGFCPVRLHSQALPFNIVKAFSLAGSSYAGGYKKLKSMSGFYEKPISVLLYQLSRRILAICILRQSLGTKKICHAPFNYFFVLHPSFSRRIK